MRTFWVGGIDIRHFRPAFPGDELTVRARLVGVGRRLGFELESSVGECTIATASHRRAVVDRRRFRSDGRGVAGATAPRG